MLQLPEAQKLLLPTIKQLVLLQLLQVKLLSFTNASNTTSFIAATQNQSNPVELEKAAYTVALDAYKQGGAKKRLLNAKLYQKSS